MLKKLKRSIDLASSLILWRNPADFHGVDDVTQALLVDGKERLLSDVQILGGHVRGVGRLVRDGLRVHGLAIGTGPDDIPIVDVFAENSRELRRANELFAGVLGLDPGQVSVVESEPFESQVWAGDHGKNDLSPGTGTVGGYVKKVGVAGTFALSNNHVFARRNAAQVGEALISPLPNTKFGELDSFIPLVPLPQENEVDAAVGRIADGVQLDSQYSPPPGLLHGRRKLRVEKWGGSSGQTTGIIVDTYGSFVINSGVLGRVGFKGMITVQGTNGPFTQPGDSGSFVRSSFSGRLVGLHVGGNGSDSLACKIQPVMTRLGLEI